MIRPLSSVFALYTLTPGRRIYTLQAVRELAAAKDLTKIVGATDLGITQDRKALDLDAARLDPRGPMRVKDKDQVVDETLVAIDFVLSYHAGRQDEGATAMQARLFPGGAHCHIRLAHHEQSAANERVLEILESEDEAKWVDAHGLRPLVDDLRKAHDHFLAALKARDGHSKVSWDEVKVARATGQELYLKVVVRILAEFLDDPAGRDAMLAPIWHQEELVRAYRRQRRGALADVDPESGELLTAKGDTEAPGSSEDAPQD